MQFAQLGIQNTFPNRAVPSDFIFVIMDMGQSNAEGRAEADRLALTTYPERPANIVLFYKPDYTTSLNGDFETYMAGQNTEEPDLSASFRLFSHSLAMAYQLRDFTGNRVYIIPAGDGGTALEQNLTSPDWSPASSGECFQIFLERFFDVAMASIISSHPGKTIAVCNIWAQGESDATDNTATSNYASNFAAFYTAVRAHGTYSSYLTAAPWVIPTLNYLQTANETTINGVFTSFAAANSSHVFVVDMSAQKRKQDLTTGEKGGFTATASDDEHLSYLAQNYLGEQAATIVKTFYGLSGSNQPPYSANTQFDPSTITASGVRLQMSSSELTVDSANKITNANNSLGATDFTTVATSGHEPRYKVDKFRGSAWFSPLATLHRMESNAAIGTSLFAGSWSCAFWTKPRNPVASTIQTVFQDTQDTPPTNDARVQVAILDAKIYGIIGVVGTGIQFITSNTITGTNSTDWAGATGEDVFDWVHVAITVTSGDKVRVYINGVIQTMQVGGGFTDSVAGLTLASYVNNTNKLQVGARRSGASTYDQFYFGMLRELVIQPGVVYSTTDIANLMLD